MLSKCVCIITSWDGRFPKTRLHLKFSSVETPSLKAWRMLSIPQRNLKGTPISMNASIHPKNIQLPLQEEMSNEYTHSNQQGSQLYITRMKNNKLNKYGKHTTRFSTWQNEGFFVCSTGTQVYRLHPPPFAKQCSVSDLLRFCDMLF